MKLMKIISVIGDSHTWGQGVGAEAYMEPGAQSGDLRMLPFGFPFYVNLIRDAYNIKYGSSQKEYYSESLAELCDGSDGRFGVLRNKKIILRENFGLARIFVKLGTAPSSLNIKLDGNDVIGGKSIACKSDKSFNECIAMHNVVCDDGFHELEISACNDTELILFRIELYTGEYAVVNCGIGSCDTRKYFEKYFCDYVGQLKPYAVIFEGNTINDWLRGESTAAYREDITRLTKRIKMFTDKIIMHTPMPIGGSLYCKENGESYDDYIKTMRDVANELNVPLADTYITMKTLIKDVPEERLGAFFFADKWHPNANGHYIYAREILNLAKDIF